MSFFFSRINYNINHEFVYHVALPDKVNKIQLLKYPESIEMQLLYKESNIIVLAQII